MQVHAALVAVQLMFGALGVVMKMALVDLPPTGLIAARMAAATVVFLIVWLAEGGERVARADLGRIAVYALFGLVVNQLLFVEGLERTTATNAVVLGTSIPVFTALVAVVLGREQATLLKLVGLAVALGGALLLVLPSRLQGGPLVFGVGNALVLANSLSYSIYLVLSRDVLGRYRTSTVVALTFLFGCVGVLPVGAGAFVHALPAISARTVWALGYIVVFATVGTYFLIAWSLRRVPSSLVAIYIYLQPVVGALLAAWVLGERPGLGTAVAAGAIFVGIWLVGVDARRASAVARRPALPPP